MRAPNAMYGWVNVVRGGHSDTGEAAEMRCVRGGAFPVVLY